MATVSDLVYEAKREAGALVAELELQLGPGGTAMKALKLYERIGAVERALQESENPGDGPIPPGCDRCERGAFGFVPARDGRGVERCDCARGEWLREHERVRNERRMRRRKRASVDVKRLAAGER